MNIELDGLYANAFRDIGIDQAIDIPKKTLCGVSGKNEDAGGSNGSGKTSFILIDKVALFGAKFVELTSQDCKNRHLDDVTQLGVKLHVGTKDVRVTRTIGGKLILSVDGEVTEGKVEDIQPRIEALLGISSDHLSYLTYKAQGDYGGFVRMKDSDKKQFLSQFFHLEKIEKAGVKVDENLKINATSMIEAKAKIESLRDSVTFLEQDVRNVTDILESQDFKNKLEKLKADKTKFELNQQDLIYARETVKTFRSPEPPNEMLTKQSLYYQRCRDMEEAIRKSEKASSDLTWIASQLVETKNKLTHAQDGKCHACGQTVKAADADRTMSANMKKLEELAAKANQLRLDVVDVKALGAEKYKSQLEYDIVSDQIANFKANNNLSELKSRESFVSAAVTALKSSIESDERYINHLSGQLKDAKEKNERATFSLNKLESTLNTLTAEKEILEQSSKILSRSGFLGYIFDSVLDEINYEANLNTQMIPNIRHLRVYFSPDRAIKTTGATSKEITCSIYDGSNIVSFKTLSGGEQRSMSIAIDEAIDTILSQRLGVHVGWKFLDEPFDAIDNSSKEALLEFFRLKSANKTYLIVDHSSEFNAAVDKRITVTKRNGIATIDG